MFILFIVNVQAEIAFKLTDVLTVGGVGFSIYGFDSTQQNQVILFMANNTNSSLISAYSQLTINNSSVGYSIQSHSLNGLLLNVQQRLAYGNNAPGGQEVFLVFSELKLTYYYQFFKKSSVFLNLNVTNMQIFISYFIIFIIIISHYC